MKDKMVSADYLHEKEQTMDGYAATETEKIDEPQVVAGETVTRTGVVVGDGSAFSVRVRNAPHLKDGKVLDTIAKGSRVRILDDPRNGFYKISTPTIKEGYIVANLIKEE